RRTRRITSTANFAVMTPIMPGITTCVQRPLTTGTQNADWAAPRLLAEYDSDAHGPLFAVSDEGSAGWTVVDAAYASAKAQALSPLDPFALGVILDGERMTSAGEVPIGPPEYAALAAAAGRRPTLERSDVGFLVLRRP
ncbi:MAG: hypothetical protein G01um1014106_693, partial [Parcubacteria group bacterium Gr01-1014_106]